MSRAAVFLDRDGTIIADTGFVRLPADVCLLPGAAEAIRRLNLAGRAVVVVTNQSGIARGLLTEEDYRSVAERTEQTLTEGGARVDATYMCPHYPTITGPCECRKPGLQHYRMAAEALDLDMARSDWVGDRMSDLEPAPAFGGRGWLIAAADTPVAVEARQRGFAVVTSLAAAVDGILARG